MPRGKHVLGMPKGRHVYGTVKVGEKGQIVIPKEARSHFGIQPGDTLVVMGDEAQGLALVREGDLLALAEAIRSALREKEEMPYGTH